MSAGKAAGVRPGGEYIRLVSEGHAVPFSKGLLATSLTATGLPPDTAYQVAMDVEWHLRRTRAREISVDRLNEMVGQVLAGGDEPIYYERYLKWRRLAQEERPVIVLIGGATGVGKSTIAAQLAERLGVVRIISTDAIREVMRAFFSPHLMPAIHYSSFEANRAVRTPLGAGLDPHVVGFMEQVEMVNVGVEAILTRAARERTSMLVEGVHIVPGLIKPQPSEDAVILPLVVAVRDRELHRNHFLVREQETAGRRLLRRYVKSFEGIRCIQDFLLERAEAERVVVVENIRIDDTVATVVDALYELIGRGHATAVEART